MTRLRNLLKSHTGRLAEHYAAIFAGTAAASLIASTAHIDGIHGIHALAAALVGAGSTALKAGYDAVRQLAIPAIAAWLAARKPAPAASTPPDPPSSK